MLLTERLFLAHLPHMVLEKGASHAVKVQIKTVQH